MLMTHLDLLKSKDQHLEVFIKYKTETKEPNEQKD